jgi:hypothetical protein
MDAKEGLPKATGKTPAPSDGVTGTAIEPDEVVAGFVLRKCSPILRVRN